MMMGALDGLISVAAVMLGVGGGTADLNSMVSFNFIQRYRYWYRPNQIKNLKGPHFYIETCRSGCLDSRCLINVPR